MWDDTVMGAERSGIEAFGLLCQQSAQPVKSLQTTMNVSILRSKLLIYSQRVFYPSTLLVRTLRA
ncbi:hypothetical protein EMIT0357P_10500 [Pseudomonas marginalis]